MSISMYLTVAGGIVLSVVLPWVSLFVPKPPTASAQRRKWERIRPYLATGAFSLLTALLLMAAVGDQLGSWKAALFAGYTWDSTMQKLFTGNTGSGA